jgi:predicted acylesterase/phospholipase RssA
MKNLVVGPGAMGFFLFLGVLARLKKDKHLDDLEAFSGASAGALLGFMYCLAKGDVSKILDFSLDAPVKQVMKLNIKCLLKNYGLVSWTKIRKVFMDACAHFIGKDDVTFKELYEWFPVKLHVSSYCVEFMKTVYFSVDTSPSMSVLDAVCASVAVPFMISSVKLSDGYNYIDGGAAETTPGGPFLGQNDVLTICIDFDKNIFPDVKDLKTHAIRILYSTMKMRHVYTFPHISIDCDGFDMFDFAVSHEGKLKMYLKGWSQTFS